MYSLCSETHRYTWETAKSKVVYCSKVTFVPKTDNLLIVGLDGPIKNVTLCHG